MREAMQSEYPSRHSESPGATYKKEFLVSKLVPDVLPAAALQRPLAAFTCVVPTVPTVPTVCSPGHPDLWCAYI